MNNPSEYSDERRRRIECFDRHLRLMIEQRRCERHLDCGITFSEDPPDDLRLDALEAGASLPPVFTGVEHGIFAHESGQLGWDVAPASGSGAGVEGTSYSQDSDGSERFLQHYFMKRTFLVDIPNSTLRPEEARRLLRDRSGFRYRREHRWPFLSFEQWREEVRDWNPVEKEYLNSDTRAAAEDMAYVIFDLWHFPLNTPFYYQAHLFSRARRGWEGTGLLD